MRRSKFVENLATLFVRATVLAFICSTFLAAEGASKVLEEWQIASQDWEQVRTFLGDVEVPGTAIYEMNIKIFSDPDVDLASYRTYSIDYTNLESAIPCDSGHCGKLPNYIHSFHLGINGFFSLHLSRSVEPNQHPSNSKSESTYRANPTSKNCSVRD